MKSFIAGAVCISMIGMVGGVMSPGYVHHNNSALAEYLMYVNNSYSDITYLYSIGQSVTGQELWVLAIGKHMHDYVPLRPSVKYVGNMHGNEVVGRELLIHLIDFYVTSYGTNATITNFLNTTVVHFMPTMNPDGYDSAVEGGCDDDVGRKNANGIDLNRNFPDYLRNRSQYGPIQQETKAVMEWTSKHNFILSANLFGGAAVASYPFDQYVDAEHTRETFAELEQLAGTSCPEIIQLVNYVRTYWIDGSVGKPEHWSVSTSLLGPTMTWKGGTNDLTHEPAGAPFHSTCSSPFYGRS